MIIEKKIRNAVRKFLLEAEQTRRPGRGGYKKQIQQAGSLAQSNPSELMKRLGVTALQGNSDIEKLNSLLSQATSGTDVMSQAFNSPSPRRDNATGSEGVRVPVNLIPPRDARKYLEHTLIAAQNSKTALFVDDIQVEILGNDVLLYFSSKPYSWGKKPTRSRPAKKQNDSDATAESENKNDDVLGEPDFNKDRDTYDSDEASVSAMVSGPMTPLGTGPTYPDKPDKKPKSAVEITGRAFAGAKPVKTNK